MKIFNFWESWVVLYLISAVIFSQTFRVSNRQMKNAGSLAVLLELFTAFFAVFFLPFFEFTFPTDFRIYFTFLIVVGIYAIVDRLNIEARYGLEPSTFSMLKQLSTVFMIFFGLIFLKEQFELIKLVGAFLIIFANFLLAFEKGKVSFNRYFVLCFISNFLFAIAMLINVNIADSFNLAFYTILTVSLPAILITIFEKHTVRELREEFSLYDKGKFFIAAFTWCLMLISSVRAYQLGSVTVIAPLFTLTSILNAIVEFFFHHDKNKLIQKLISAVLLVIGVFLVKI